MAVQALTIAWHHVGVHGYADQMVAELWSQTISILDFGKNFKDDIFNIRKKYLKFSKIKIFWLYSIIICMHTHNIYIHIHVYAYTYKHTLVQQSPAYQQPSTWLSYQYKCYKIKSYCYQYYMPQSANFDGATN